MQQNFISQFLNSITSVSGPLTLIAFIVVALLAALMIILKSTGGLDKAQDLLLKNASLERGEFRQIFNMVLIAVLVVAGMLLGFLAYNVHINFKKSEPKSGLICYAQQCTGRDPKDNGCDIGVATITSRAFNLPKFSDPFQDIRLELRHSDKCNASWARSKVPPNSALYVEGENGQRYSVLNVEEYSVNEVPYFYTDMAPGNIRRRACFTTNDETYCTNFVN